MLYASNIKQEIKVKYFFVLMRFKNYQNKIGNANGVNGLFIKLRDKEMFFSLTPDLGLPPPIYRRLR